MRHLPKIKLFTAVAICFMMLTAGCIKSSDSLIAPSESMKFEKGNLKNAITSIDSLSLFLQALDRAGLSGMLETNSAYTIFAPGNSAMKAAALDADQIRMLTVDSLRKIISYHIVPGAIENSAIGNQPVSRFLQTIRNDTVLVPLQGFKVKDTWLVVQQADQFYLNGFGLGNVSPVEASNGYIYPIGLFVKDLPIDASRTLWEVIDTDPELSMYRDAVLLLDSIKESESWLESEVFFFLISPPSDRPLFAERKSNPANNSFINRTMPTVLAPTNKAFHDAGFHSIDDLRTFAFRYPFGVKIWYSDDFSEIMFDLTFSSLDTLLARNTMVNDLIQDGALKYPARLFYSDLLKGRINNGTFNRIYRSVQGFGAYVKYPFDLQFSNDNGTAYVQWHPGSEKIMIKKDADPLHPVNNFNLDNGVLYKVEKLFYPFN